ncbi:MAG: T9SS type A sorting domain-containing protein [Bacteroidetes bacterium]|nr:T9SS type A sorting domain-containing protein [Bacteroidota bacterium]
MVFGNAVDPGSAQFLSQLTLDTSCVHTGTSLQVILLAAGDTSCTPPVLGPVNDECAGAVDINAAFGGTVNVVQAIGPYDNTLATTSSLDPTLGFECFGEPDGTGTGPELNNTLWFTFTGDGETYAVESGTCNGVINYISDGDTQFGLYTGSCGNFTPVACNEDGPSATATTYPAGLTIATTQGTVYYLMVDGFSFQGAISTGEFCLLVKKLTSIGCNDPSLTAGNESQSSSSVCFGDTVNFTTDAVIAPVVGAVSGFSWVISNADISGTHNPLDPATFVASYGFLTSAPAISSLDFVNDTTFLSPGTYYWTPLVFGNAVDASGTAQFLSQLTLDTACIHTGTSLMVTLLAPGDTSCIPPVPGPVNDECVGAIDINASFGGALNVVQSSGPYDNTLATTSASEPTTGFECFGEPNGSGSAPEINNTLWFTFTGDGATYLVESGTCNGVVNYISDGDTQFGLYTGACGSLSPLACNEDGPSATATVYPAGLTIATTAGTVYYLMVDGFNFQGALSQGEYCILVKKLFGVGIAETISTNAGLSVYPSPATDKVNIQFTSGAKGNTELKITDITGREVRKSAIVSTPGANTISVDVKSLANGVYWVSVNDDQGTRTVKFLKK